MSKTISLKDREINLDFRELNNLNLEDILVIDYNNLKEDISTFYFVVNQIGFLLNEANDLLREKTFQLEILKNKLDEYKSSQFILVKKDLENEGNKNPTISLIESQIKLKKGHIELQKSIEAQTLLMIKATSEKDNLNTLYWAAQGKAETLKNLSKSLIL